MFWMLIWETFSADMLIRALTPRSRATAAMVDELCFESFSFNALVGSLRVWVTKSSHHMSVRAALTVEAAVGLCRGAQTEQSLEFSGDSRIAQDTGIAR